MGFKFGSYRSVNMENPTPNKRAALILLPALLLAYYQFAVLNRQHM